jgi:hypothetical protein
MMRLAPPLTGAGRPGSIAVLVLLVVCPVRVAHAIGPGVLTFEDADIREVVRQIDKLTGTTFLFDPDRVKGRITILPLARHSAPPSPKTVMPGCWPGWKTLMCAPAGS